jgi:Lipase (class 3)
MTLSTYSPRLALELGRAAAAAYESAAAVTSLAKERGAAATVIEAGPSAAALIWTRQHVVVAPRGSDFGDGGIDWRLNARVCKRPMSETPGLEHVEGLGHSGFLEAYEGLSAAVRPLLRELLAGGRELLLGGHSQGAALAVLLACEHLEAAAYPWACPRVGNPEFAAWFARARRAPTHRLVLALRGVQDLVTRLPPSSFGFAHVGEAHVFSESQRFDGDDAWQQLRVAVPVSRLEALRLVGRGTRAVLAHSRARGLEAFEADLARSENKGVR